jgi:hypothetical protein
MVALALTGMLLAACGPSGKETAAALPYAPADIQSCFREAVGIPDRALTKAEVESLWKQDRLRVKINALCGKRMLAWYGDLQTNYR